MVLSQSSIILHPSSIGYGFVIMSKIHSILFICTGNSCRSVMAEGLMKKHLAAAGKSYIEVRSAGIAASPGTPPTEDTVKVMNEEGLDVSGHGAEEVTEDMIEEADLILVMDAAHKGEIIRRVPAAASKTFLLKEYAYPGKIADPETCGIADPIGLGIDYYRHTREVIGKEIERIVGGL